MTTEMKIDIHSYSDADGTDGMFLDAFKFPHLTLIDKSKGESPSENPYLHRFTMLGL